MNKNEFVNEINIRSGLSKRDCKLCLETIINIITKALQNGENISISNFGKFKVNNVKAKYLYNFQTKNNVVVEAKKTPVFKPSENLKQCIK